MDEKIYPTYKLARLASILSEQGVETEQLLDGTGIEPRLLTSNSARISKRQVTRAYKNAVEISKVPEIGLLAGSKLCLTDYGVYGLALISSADLRSALEFSIKYHNLATPTSRMSLVIDESQKVATFRMIDILETRQIYQFNIDMQLALVFSLFKDMVGRHFRFKEIWADFPKPRYASMYEDIFECPVHFDQDHNDLRFDLDYLYQPLQRANPITAASMRELCDEVLLEMEIRVGLAHDVYEVITKDLRIYSNLELVADALYMSSRTLRRKLAAQGTSFQKILNDVRKQLAIEFIRNTRMSTEEIADRLGFSDPANFRHAFKRWTNQTTSAFR